VISGSHGERIVQEEWNVYHKMGVLYTLSIYSFAGVVQTFSTQPWGQRWTSYRANALGAVDPVVWPHGLYLAMGDDDTQRRAAYRELFRGHIDGNDLEGIRSCLQTGTPLGNDRFRTQIEQALKVKVGQSRRGGPKKPKEGKVDPRVKTKTH
jgi:hypothetical protein